MDVIDYFRWKEKEAIDFINQTKKIVRQWKERANQVNISNREQIMMESAFEK